MITSTEIIHALQKSAEAHELLESLWLECGPYNKPKNVTDELWMKVQYYFKFDDSE